MMPCQSDAKYVREMQAMAAAAEMTDPAALAGGAAAASSEGKDKSPSKKGKERGGSIAAGAGRGRKEDEKLLLRDVHRNQIINLGNPAALAMLVEAAENNDEDIIELFYQAIYPGSKPRAWKVLVSATATSGGKGKNTGKKDGGAEKKKEKKPDGEFVNPPPGHPNHNPTLPWKEEKKKKEKELEHHLHHGHGKEGASPYPPGHPLHGQPGPNHLSASHSPAGHGHHGMAYPPGHPLHGVSVGNMPHAAPLPGHPGHPSHPGFGGLTGNNGKPVDTHGMFGQMDHHHMHPHELHAVGHAYHGHKITHEEMMMSKAVLEYHITEGLSSPSRIRLRWCNACQAYIKGERTGFHRHNRPSAYSVGHADPHNRPVAVEDAAE